MDAIRQELSRLPAIANGLTGYVSGADFHGSLRVRPFAFKWNCKTRRIPTAVFPAVINGCLGRNEVAGLIPINFLPYGEFGAALRIRTANIVLGRHGLYQLS